MRTLLRQYCQSRAVTLLLLLNIAASLTIWTGMALQALFGTSLEWVMALFALPADFMAFLHRPWTLATYMVAQANPLQLLFNMLWLVWFGRLLWSEEGDRSLWSLYIGGGLAGGMFYLLAGSLWPGSGTVLMGSSAAVLSVMTYTAVRWPKMSVPLLLIGEVQLKWIAVFTIILTLLGASGPAAHCAHIGGVLYPILRAAMKRVKLPKPKEFRINVSKPRRRKVPEMMNNPEKLLDELLDKVRVSGFDSLSKEEKATLNRISETLNKE